MDAVSFTINARKYSGEIQRSWNAKALSEDGSLLSFIGKFDRKIKHPDIGIIEPGTISREYFWHNRWYNIFVFYKPNGEFFKFYCNVSMPPQINENVLDYIDLDLDLLVTKNLTYKVLDKDEFLKNSKIYGYPQNIVDKAFESLNQLKDLVNRHQFPFDIEI